MMGFRRSPREGMMVLAWGISAALFPLSPLSASPGLNLIYDIDLGYFMTSPKAPWVGDPFARESGFYPKSTAEEKFQLTGILYDDRDPVAVINGRSVHIGERVGGRTVTDIYENYVILKKGNSSIDLTLPADEEDGDGVDDADTEDSL